MEQEILKKEHKQVRTFRVFLGRLPGSLFESSSSFVSFHLPLLLIPQLLLVNKMLFRKSEISTYVYNLNY